MQEAALIFPHQLFRDHPAVVPGRPVILVEEFLFFRQYAFHRQKLILHRASMRAFRDNLPHGTAVRYIEAMDPLADIRQLIPALAASGLRTLHIVEPADDWLYRRIIHAAGQQGVHIHWHVNPMFLTPPDELDAWFNARKRFFQTDFYIRQRKRLDILLDPDGKPRGGQWSFDAENRLRYPKDRHPPALPDAEQTPYHDEATAYVNRHFPGNPGSMNTPWNYPVTPEAADAWLDEFLAKRFADFGPYEDAIVAQAHILHHSLLTPALNIGLLKPEDIVRKTITFAQSHDIALSSLEGFIRQVIGWREFIHGVYRAAGRRQRTANALSFTRKIPSSFYTGHTGLAPVDTTIRKVLDTGYCHHIERLMILGNIMLLCEFDPDEVYRWFMELFIDAYDWVMVPNIYGMSQYADGGLMTTKPYFSGSNYLMKMSDYPKGPWQAVWDGLFWRFMDRHRDLLSSNPRLGMLVKTFNRMPDEKRRDHLRRAEDFLAGLK
jgi:deoxyribodipyrimidine photolyase-related protein